MIAPIPQPLEMPGETRWQRQENEPARWHMRFRVYLSMGVKRSVNAVHNREIQERGTKSRTNKAGEAWYNAAHRFQWAARAEAYDQAQDEQKATLMRAIASRSAFVSRPYRIVELNTLADAISRQIEAGQDVATFTVLLRQMREIMGDIKTEIDEWGITLDASVDAAALEHLKDKNARLDDLAHERELDEDAELDRKIKEMAKRGLI